MGTYACLVCVSMSAPDRLRWVCWSVWLCWRTPGPSSSGHRSWVSRGGCRRSCDCEAQVCPQGPTRRSRTSSGARLQGWSPAGMNTWRWNPDLSRWPSGLETSSYKGQNNAYWISKKCFFKAVNKTKVIGVYLQGNTISVFLLQNVPFNSTCSFLVIICEIY